MKWKEIAISTTSEAAELVSDIFFEFGGSGVSISDKNDLEEFLRTGSGWDYIADLSDSFPDGYAIVKGYVSLRGFKKSLRIVEEKLSDLRESSSGFLSVGSLEVSFKEIDDKDFGKEWKKHFRPITIKDIIICPKWIKLDKVEGKEIVLIEPGMAFGTGEHETTRLCIDLMQDYELKGKTVLDIGCGSGILGICALKLGASRCFMSDFDQLATEASRKNSKMNKVLENAEITQSNLLDEAGFKGDLILINIVAEVLIGVASAVKNNLNENGVVILSGIIHAKLQSVRDAYLNNGFKEIKHQAMGEWNALAFTL